LFFPNPFVINLSDLNTKWFEHYSPSKYTRSVVRRAVDELSGAQVACKEISHQSRAAITCLTREVTALRALQHPAPHPNIVQLHALHRDSERTYLFLTSPRGAVTLRNYLDDHVRRIGPLSECEARLILRQLLCAVQHCHVRGVAHRDLKLENVLIVPRSKHVLVIDFGLALTDHVTRVNESLGSPLYMAPEVLSAREHSACSADLWAVGVIAQYVATIFSSSRTQLTCDTSQLLFHQYPFMADTLDELQLLVTTQRYKCPTVSLTHHTATTTTTTTTMTTTTTTDDDDVSLADLLHALLAPSPQLRITAAQALQHPWITCSTPR